MREVWIKINPVTTNLSESWLKLKDREIFTKHNPGEIIMLFIICTQNLKSRFI